MNIRTDKPKPAPLPPVKLTLECSELEYKQLAGILMDELDWADYNEDVEDLLNQLYDALTDAGGGYIKAPELRKDGDVSLHQRAAT